MEKTHVYLREYNQYKAVKITSKNKPDIEPHIQDKWQQIINLIANVFNVPAGLIMKITKEHMEVFLKSTNKDNPYDTNGKDQLGHGLYCETVIGTDKPLEIKDALKNKKWQNNPDVAINMTAYFGMPIKWHDGEVFGTICILSDDSIPLTNKHREIFELFRNAIEADLYNLELIKHLEKVAQIDVLTSVPNRRHILEQLDIAYHAYQRDNIPFCLIMIDIDNFKHINDQYGHDKGDDVLKTLTDIFTKRLRKTDVIGRLGGDEFLIIMRHTEEKNAKEVIASISKSFNKNTVFSTYDIDITYGIAEIDKHIKNIEALIKIADQQLLDNKQQKKCAR